MTSFSELGVPAPLVAALAAEGKTEAFPIQVDTLPDTLAGRDVLGRGKTGSGKTIAFALPIAARLGTTLAGGRRRASHPLALVLAPTRELATQIAATLEPLADAYNLTTTTIFGGVSQKRQVDALRAGVDILVACPGRLDDLMKQGLVSLDAVEITVLDEADHMADLGFLPVVTRILDKTPTGGQRMLFSATLDNGVDKVVKRFLQSPVMHSVDDETSHVDRMTHHVFEVADLDAKNDLVKALASGKGRSILFMRTKHHAKRLAKKLTEQGIPAVDLHGNLSQPQRDRNLAAFGDGSVRVMVATDVAARGVHIDDVELVVHVDPPTEHKAYLHRSGRTARAGATGDVVTIMLPTQRGDVRDVLRKAAIAATPLAVSATSSQVTTLVGEPAPYVKPAPKVQQQRQPSRKPAGQGAGGRGGERGTAGSRGGAGNASSRAGSREDAAGSAQRSGGGRRRGRGAGGGQQQTGGRSAQQTSGGRGGQAAAGRSERASGREQQASGRGQQSSRSSRTTGGANNSSSGRSGQSIGARTGIRVGDVVRGNGSTSRGRGPRRAQG
ncbi:DEAD/DEAH box helicase [Humibacter ginsenosidimutans]|uniref:DEAD/DEAH box helicase n=1 Tax=Humibacter ginsenosidimutans TaxID=2599293 RepID=A0A5B8M5D4_9MICO|nr:DEAD/DEAH box helicase [Humibacter ginsenosidimutans]QDZ15055.1 DEAD/DEAH box helicase [Humibacter ginsenosidimutans]